MLAVVLGAVLFSRAIRPVSGIALALFAVLIVDPLAVLSFGFWLSFGAVTALLYSLGQRPGAQRHWRQWGRAQWAVALGLLPLLLLLFGRASLIAPLVNLVAVPLFSLVLLPGVLIASFLGLVTGLEQPLIALATLLEWGFDLLHAASGWSWATTTVSLRPIWVWAAAFSGAVLLLAPRGLPGRWLGLVLLLSVPMERPEAPGPGEVRFTLLDVGQGLAAVVRTSRHTLVYDTGPRFPSGFNTGSAVVLPYLRSQGIGRIDTLVVSHADQDHAGGLAGLKGRIPIDRVLSGEADRIASDSALPCIAGTVWHWDGVDFGILHPVDAELEGNDSSCVLRVSTGDTSVLLTGDIGASVEADLEAAQHERLRSTILVAAHHGSDTSTSTEFLQAVAPRYVLYGVGFANRFGFPSLAVRERVAGFGAQQVSTARTGAIAFRLRADGLEGPWLRRRDERRLWTHRFPETDRPF
jgi:competence protein ComEC